MVSNLSELTRSLRKRQGEGRSKQVSNAFRLAVRSHKDKLQSELNARGRAEFTDTEGNTFVIERAGGER